MFVYLDDILVASSSMEQHAQHLRFFIEHLHEHGLIFNIAKCQFGRKNLDFLGHRITCNGVMPLPDKVLAIRDIGKPLFVKGLQEFLGMVNFYHRFVPHAVARRRGLTVEAHHRWHVRGIYRDSCWCGGDWMNQHCGAG